MQTRTDSRAIGQAMPAQAPRQPATLLAGRCWRVWGDRPACFSADAIAGPLAQFLAESGEPNAACVRACVPPIESQRKTDPRNRFFVRNSCGIVASVIGQPIGQPAGRTLPAGRPYHRVAGSPTNGCYRTIALRLQFEVSSTGRLSAATNGDFGGVARKTPGTQLRGVHSIDVFEQGK